MRMSGLRSKSRSRLTSHLRLCFRLTDHLTSQSLIQSRRSRAPRCVSLPACTQVERTDEDWTYVAWRLRRMATYRPGGCSFYSDGPQPFFLRGVAFYLVSSMRFPLLPSRPVLLVVKDLVTWRICSVQTYCHVDQNGFVDRSGNL